MVKMAKTEAERRAAEKYKAAHRVSMQIDLNRGTEDDIIEYVSKIQNKSGYVKALIRADMAREAALLDGQK